MHVKKKVAFLVDYLAGFCSPFKREKVGTGWMQMGEVSVEGFLSGSFQAAC